MGLSMGPTSIVPALIGGGRLAAPLFSLCLALDGGAMALGAIDESLHSGPTQVRHRGRLSMRRPFYALTSPPRLSACLPACSGGP